MKGWIYTTHQQAQHTHSKRIEIEDTQSYNASGLFTLPYNVPA